MKDPVTPDPTPEQPSKPTLRERFKVLMAENAKVAIPLYFGIFALTLAGFVIAIQAGVKVESTAGTAGLLGAAWVATKLTQPLRILATLVLTPLLAQLLKRFQAPPQEPR